MVAAIRKISLLFAALLLVSGCLSMPVSGTERIQSNRLTSAMEDEAAFYRDTSDIGIPLTGDGFLKGLKICGASVVGSACILIFLNNKKMT